MKTKKPTIELNEEAKQSLSNTESTANSIYEDLSDIGDQVDISKMTLEQLREEFKKFRKEHDNFKWEVKKTISDEIEKQIAPLVEQINLLTTKKTGTIYVQKLKILPIDFIKDGCDKIIYAIKKILTRRG